MNQPLTLLQLAGAQPSLPRWQDATLILIDHQREYIDGAVLIQQAPRAIAEMLRLLRKARAAGAPVVHILHHGAANARLFNPASSMVQPITGLEPGPGEQVVIKHLPNAFAATQLDDLLTTIGRKHLVVAGFATHMCVSATVRAAVDHGYFCTVVADACGTRDLPGALSGVLPAEQLHAAELAALADRFALVVPNATAWPPSTR